MLYMCVLSLPLLFLLNYWERVKMCGCAVLEMLDLWCLSRVVGILRIFRLFIHGFLVVFCFD